MAIRRRERASNGDVNWEGLCSEEFVFAFPSVLEFVSRCSWEQGVPRLTGTIMLLVDGGLWKLWCHDRDSGESLFVSGQALEEALRSLEGHLSQGTGDWRQDKGSGGGTSKKRG
jgi:hypothetical protein